MKLNLLVPLVLVILFFDCSDDDPTREELVSKIEMLNTEIHQMITISTGESSFDCRTRYITGGNGCGPIFIYGIMGIDTLQIENLFLELSETQSELYKLEGGSVCDLAFPAKDSLINGTCKACFSSEDNFECF